MPQRETDVDFDEAWERRAEETLESVEFDTELGKALGRDAQRLVAGEITEAEFHAKYHEAVLAEFGVDQRLENRAQGDGDRSVGEPSGDSGPLPGVPGEDPSRRSMLKAAGVLGAAAIGLKATESVTSAGGTAAAAESAGEGEGRDFGMVIDTQTCIACLQCMEACNEENNNTADILWRYVFRYEEDDYMEEERYLSRGCQHCRDQPCVAACPTLARHENEDGIILTDYDQCVGCRYCEVSCPYGVNYLQWASPPDDTEFQYDREVDGRTVAGNPPQGVIGKCTFCVHRQYSGDPELEDTTACEDTCPVDAIQFGDLNDPESDPRQYLAENEGEPTFRLLEDRGTEPKHIFIGNHPSPAAEPVEGPVRVEEMGLQKHRQGRDPIELVPDGGDADGD